MRTRNYFAAIILAGSFYVSSCSTENIDVPMKAKELKANKTSDGIYFDSGEVLPSGTHFQLSENPNLSLIKIDPSFHFKSKKDREEFNKILPVLSRLKGVETNVKSVCFAFGEETIAAKVSIGYSQVVFLTKDIKNDKWEIVYVAMVYY